ncbi:Ribonuclease P protein [Dioscorea alata]|uniref:Ribonuclease P protein n=3 Tax=Dioscorea alata TaxID=55571 RepID=A0ACB7VFW8_DIOAL|nr:Ribonuclease P protein [Dioscorea alata]KAH7672661.1 Ribonuclease P protein [Dioscorea alata]KAH7672663.1 Ribonuclease P protein [Dioscorea alata]
MALFFDLRIPFLESGGSPAPEIKARKDARLRAVVMAMELGYAGVAYERCFRGVLSERDRCKIPPFPLSSLLAAAPALHSTVSFHRNLLGSPLSSPFRQYTRLTVLVDSLPSIAALNSGNPLLRSYDIVAARPLNQTAFEQACQTSEVDLISIDFSQKLPFRLKLPMIEAAIKRGVYFEITYADLILDVSRRQMLSEAKLLVDWTRGRNIIISSAAPNANALRGPYDIINLSVVLLGFSMEKAKAAISKNCRSLLENALRKKHFYKEAIRIERIPDVQADTKSSWLGNWNDWDPISSGENDLPPLDDIAKFFSAASNLPKSSAIDFKSAVDDMQLRSFLSGVKLDTHLTGADSSNLSSDSSEKPSLSSVADEFPCATEKNYQQPNIVQFPFVDNMSMTMGPLEHQCEPEHVLAAKSDMETVMVDAEEPGMAVASRDDILATEGNPNSPDTNLMQSFHFKNTKPSVPYTEVGESSNEPDVILISAEKQNDDAMELEDVVPYQSSDKISPNDVEECIIVPLENYSASEQVGKRVEEREQNNNTIDIVLQPGKLVTSAISSVGQVIPEDAFDRMEERSAILSSDQVIPEDAFKKTEELSAISSVDQVITEDASKKTEEMREEVVLAEKDALVMEVLATIEKQKQSLPAANFDDNQSRKFKSGKGRQKEKMLHPVYPLPFKTLFKPLRSRKRVSQLRRTAKHT